MNLTTGGRRLVCVDEKTRSRRKRRPHRRQRRGRCRGNDGGRRQEKERLRLRKRLRMRRGQRGRGIFFSISQHTSQHKHITASAFQGHKTTPAIPRPCRLQQTPPYSPHSSQNVGWGGQARRLCKKSLVLTLAFSKN